MEKHNAMKIKLKHLFIYFLFALFYFTSCQEEVTQVENPSDQETIAYNSNLANLLSRTTANFGATDDILDGASCFSVELPVTIEVSDITMIIETPSDLQQLENLFNESSMDDDFLDFIFPITIIFSDYSQIVIENEDELLDFVSDCEIENTDAIACVDIMYPISFSVFNADFNLVDTIVVENDEALHGFLDNLDDDENVVVVSLNFPVNLQYSNGDSIEVNSNEELADAIELAGDDCSIDDCSEASLVSSLETCAWEITTYSNFPEFIGIDLVFYSDNTFAFYQEGNTYNFVSYWSLNTTENGLYLNLETDFEDFNGEWRVVECTNAILQLTKGGQTMVINQECESDLGCSLTDISSILQECPWDFSNGSGNFDTNQMIFNANGDVQISEGMAASAIGGSWDLFATDEGIWLTFAELTAFQENLHGDWLIVECDTDRIVLHKDDQTLVLEQNCNTDLFSCFENTQLIACGIDGFATFNLTEANAECGPDLAIYGIYYYESESDLQSNVNRIYTPESYSNVYNPTVIYAAIIDIYDEAIVHMFTINLIVENCNYFECFESVVAVLEVCDEGTDGLHEFDLSIAFANCTPTADLVTYHETQADAESGSNVIVNPVSYSVADMSSTVYARVEIENQVDIFPIQLNVMTCNAGNCSEADVDGMLIACEWNITSYSGSDNLNHYNFHFEHNSGIVVIYTDAITIDAMWSTSQTSDGVIIDFSDVTGPNIQAINGSWLVVECTANQLVLHHINDSSLEIVLDNNCE